MQDLEEMERNFNVERIELKAQVFALEKRMKA